jgi:hypothetical protein
MENLRSRLADLSERIDALQMQALNTTDPLPAGLEDRIDRLRTGRVALRTTLTELAITGSRQTDQEKGDLADSIGELEQVYQEARESLP